MLIDLLIIDLFPRFGLIEDKDFNFTSIPLVLSPEYIPPIARLGTSMTGPLEQEQRSGKRLQMYIQSQDLSQYSMLSTQY